MTDVYKIVGYKSEYSILTGDSYISFPYANTPIEAENKARCGGMKFIIETELWFRDEGGLK